MCGKNIQKLTKTQGMWGSPPRVREKLKDPSTRMQWNRITPACAGKTPLSQCWFSWKWDHPRVCGKNVSCSLSRSNKGGSPPRVREKPLPSISSFSFTGITPACAGKTLRMARKARWREDHPRVCGKNSGI